MVDDWSFEYSPQMKDETRIYLRDLSLAENQAFTYLYDFGDSWQHVLYLEYVSPQKLETPRCTDGWGACPPENCGGVGGYAQLLEILKDPSHPEYDGYIQWLPNGFDPDHFPGQAINEELEKFGTWHRKHPRKRSTPWHQI